MSLWRLIIRSLVYYRRAHAGVLLGALVGTTALVGALVVGDSVRFSLEQLALARLGQTEYAITFGERLCGVGLAGRLQQRLRTTVAPVLQLRGIAIADGGARRVNDVQVVGVDARFWSLAPAGAGAEVQLQPSAFSLQSSATGPSLGEGEIAVNQSLAEQLRVAVGDELLLRLENPGRLPAELPLAAEGAVSRALRVRVARVVSSAEFGSYTLQTTQIIPPSVLADLAWLGDVLEEPGRGNVLLVGGGNGNGANVGRGDRAGREPRPTVRAALSADIELGDIGVEVRELPERGVFELVSERVFITPAVVDAAVAAAGDEAVTGYSRILSMSLRRTVGARHIRLCRRVARSMDRRRVRWGKRRKGAWHMATLMIPGHGVSGRLNWW